MKKNLRTPIHQPRLYEMVAERIKNEFVEKAAMGERLPTEMEFSEIFQVSVPTVREALRSLVQEGHLHRRQGSGTYKKENVTAVIERGSHPAVAIVSPLDLTDGRISCHFTQVALNTSKFLKQRGMASQLYFGETAPASARQFDESQLCADIETGNVSAAVLLSESDPSAKYIQSMEKRGLPIISADLQGTSSGGSVVEDFLKRAVSSLMKHRRRKLACIGFGNQSRENARAMFQKLVTDHGGITDESWMIGDLHPSMSGSGYSLMREIWTTGKIKPDGLIICDDVFFQDISVAIHELGIKSPEQLLIAAYRNKGQRISSQFPIIEFEYEAEPIALQAVENVLAALKGEPIKPIAAGEPKLTDPFLDSKEELASV